MLVENGTNEGRGEIGEALFGGAFDDKLGVVGDGLSGGVERGVVAEGGEKLLAEGLGWNAVVADDDDIGREAVALAG